jgi:hypothetical protein
MHLKYHQILYKHAVCGRVHSVQLAMIPSPFYLSVDRLLPVPSKSQPDGKTSGSCSADDFDTVDNLANNGTMHRQQHPIRASAFIALLPQLRHGSLRLRASSMKILTKAGGSHLAIPSTSCNPVVEAKRPA